MKGMSTMGSTNSTTPSDESVQKTASVAPSTVTALSEGKVAQLPKRTRRAPQRAFQPPVHSHIKVDPRVMREARLLTMLGTYTRIEIIDHETVMVR